MEGVTTPRVITAGADDGCIRPYCDISFTDYCRTGKHPSLVPPKKANLDD
jgi:hypothetical protein